MPPEIITGEAAKLSADERVDKVLVSRAPAPMLRLGAEGLADLGTKGADHVKAIGLVKDQRAVKVKQNGADRLFA
jgi:methylmalonyl-CoA mutase cobalamin-binding subunit